MDRVQSIHGALLGTIVGDALGLPYEALSRRRGRRLLGLPTRHRMIFGHGMMSDDGEHACLAAQALCVAGGDVETFRRSLAWRLRWWLLGVPVGVGGATLRATFKLWLGFSPARSGVYSAGNGPAMRSTVLGAAIDDLTTLRQLVEASTLLTHTDPKAYHGAIAVALAAWCARRELGAEAFLNETRRAIPDTELLTLLDDAARSAAAGESTEQFAAGIGCENGVSGYIYKTVPVAIHAWLRYRDDYERAVQNVIALGGDTDTVAAIVGGIIAAGRGVERIPKDWKTHLLEWPRSTAWVRRLAERLAESVESQQPVRPPSAGPLVIVRNILLLFAVIVHIARRALPPY